ncbi:hypothetical protein Glove_454g12 [Diversispora epigaea]|uniref:Uncharacterized protein n=1 Tax=Diversispora epigaea TaxID=1348612 RepID=A0A397GU27_9GLOM|nr:hypothetical protein Glove_454g12 [Diversispora epigaea]
MYNVLSGEIDLSPATLASFYRHQKFPQRISLDKIEAWVEKENQKKDNSVIVSNGSRNNFSAELAQVRRAFMLNSFLFVPAPCLHPPD